MRWLGKDETVNWIKTRKPRNRTLPEEALSEDDVKRLAGAAYTTRDRAFILMLYESGARIGELLPLKIKHLSFDRHGALVYLSGKTEDRKVRLVASVSALQRWLNEHLGKDDPESYLWTQIPTPYHPPGKIKKHASLLWLHVPIITRAGGKAGGKKKVNPHVFRHARATFMARHLKEPEMGEFFGWGRDSEMPAIYIHLSGRDVDNSVLGIYGIKEARKNQEPTLRARSCPRFQELNDPASRFCGKCGLPLNQLSEEDRLVRLVVELLKIVAETNPGIKDGFRELVKEKYA